MLKPFFFILTIFVFLLHAKSQSSLHGPFTLGYGRVNGVVYMSRNVDIENSVTGNAYTMLYTFTDIFRGELLFQQFKSFDMLPSWKQVKVGLQGKSWNEITSNEKNEIKKILEGVK